MENSDLDLLGLAELLFRFTLTGGRRWELSLSPTLKDKTKLRLDSLPQVTSQGVAGVEAEPRT